MFSNRLYSPLRYPGGKAPFAPFIAKVMEVNGVSGGITWSPTRAERGLPSICCFMDMQAIFISTMQTPQCLHFGFL